MEKHDKKIQQNIRRLHMLRALGQMRKLVSQQAQQDRQNKFQVIIILVTTGVILAAVSIFIFSSYVQQSPSIIQPGGQLESVR